MIRPIVAASLATLLGLTAPSTSMARPPHHKGGNAQAGAMHQQQAMIRQQQAAVKHQQQATTHASGQRAGNRNNQQQNAQVVSSLQSTMSRLNQADHDYQGHRAQAIHELGQAIHTLHPQANINGNSNLAARTGASGRNTAQATGAGKGSGTGPKITQAESDQHLRAAQESLMAIHSGMATAGAPAASGNSTHMQQAHGHVQRALEHLNTALALK